MLHKKEHAKHNRIKKCNMLDYVSKAIFFYHPNPIYKVTRLEYIFTAYNKV